MTPVETAWTAGLFEGEGCISLNRVGSALGGSLVLRTTDADVLVRFAAASGCGRIRGPLAVAKSHHKPSYEWRIGRWSDVERLLRAWLPYFGERRAAKATELLARPRTYAAPQGSGHCLKGHALPPGHRQCRPCAAANQRARRERLRTAA